MRPKSLIYIPKRDESIPQLFMWEFTLRHNAAIDIESSGGTQTETETFISYRGR